MKFEHHFAATSDRAVALLAERVLNGSIIPTADEVLTLAAKVLCGEQCARIASEPRIVIPPSMLRSRR